MQSLPAISKAGQTVIERAERVANDRAEEHQDRKNNNGDQNKDQRILSFQRLSMEVSPPFRFLHMNK